MDATLTSPLVPAASCRANRRCGFARAAAAIDAIENRRSAVWSTNSSDRIRVPPEKACPLATSVLSQSLVHVFRRTGIEFVRFETRIDVSKARTCHEEFADLHRVRGTALAFVHGVATQVSGRRSRGDAHIWRRFCSREKQRPWQLLGHRHLSHRRGERLVVGDRPATIGVGFLSYAST